MSIEEEITQALDDLERREKIRIVYACESGSRAWGFPSADSDYDVRFIYVRSIEWYLSIDFERKRDVIELPIKDDLDVNGWDLTKALRLLRKSNPTLIEWLGSPIVYRDRPAISDALRALLPHYYAPVRAIYHYHSMVRKHANTYLKGELINPKKYFYALRTLLAVKWIEGERGIVPMEFERLVDAIVDSAELRAAIDDLLVRKRSGAEMGLEPKTPILNDYIERELERLATATHTFASPEADTARLDALFRYALRESWSDAEEFL
jgi:predicted nucleotidyltransferase